MGAAAEERGGRPSGWAWLPAIAAGCCFLLVIYWLLFQPRVVVIGSKLEDVDFLSAALRSHGRVSVWALFAPEDPQGLQLKHILHSSVLYLAAASVNSHVVIAERLGVENVRRDPLGKYSRYTSSLLPFWRFWGRNPFEVALLHGDCSSMVQLLTAGGPGSAGKSPQVLTVQCRQNRKSVFEQFVKRTSIAPLGPHAEKRLFHDVTAVSSKVFVASLLKGTEPQVASAPLPDKGTALLDALQKSPCDPFPKGSHGTTVRRAFPDYQFMVVGRAGVGKSTFLHWLGVHGMLGNEVVSKFGTTTGGASHTLSLTKARFGPHTILFDTKGLPSWDLSFIPDLQRLLHGQMKLGPMQWDAGVFSMDIVTVLWNCAYWFFVLCWLVDGPQMVVGTAPNWKPTTGQQYLGIIGSVLLWIILFQRPQTPLPRLIFGSNTQQEPSTTPHAILLIASYPFQRKADAAEGMERIKDFDKLNGEEELSFDASAPEIREAKAFVSALREAEPTLPIVVAVTHIERCPSYSTAQECAEELADGIGYMEVGNVFPLPAVKDSSLSTASDARAKLEASSLAPILNRLQLKANGYYEKVLDLAV